MCKKKKYIFQVFFEKVNVIAEKPCVDNDKAYKGTFVTFATVCFYRSAKWRRHFY